MDLRTKHAMLLDLLILAHDLEETDPQASEWLSELVKELDKEP